MKKSVGTQCREGLEKFNKNKGSKHKEAIALSERNHRRVERVKILREIEQLLGEKEFEKKAITLRKMETELLKSFLKEIKEKKNDRGSKDKKKEINDSRN
jgi:myo-inositol-1-phosphate synthase